MTLILTSPGPHVIIVWQGKKANSLMQRRRQRRLLEWRQRAALEAKAAQQQREVSENTGGTKRYRIKRREAAPLLGAIGGGYVAVKEMFEAQEYATTYH